jgi:hypothetical protein
MVLHLDCDARPLPAPQVASSRLGSGTGGWHSLARYRLVVLQTNPRNNAKKTMLYSTAMASRTRAPANVSPMKGRLRLRANDFNHHHSCLTLLAFLHQLARSYRSGWRFDSCRPTGV